MISSSCSLIFFFKKMFCLIRWAVFFLKHTNRNDATRKGCPAWVNVRTMYDPLERVTWGWRGLVGSSTPGISWWDRCGKGVTFQNFKLYNFIPWNFIESCYQILQNIVYFLGKDLYFIYSHNLYIYIIYMQNKLYNTNIYLYYLNIFYIFKYIIV